MEIQRAGTSRREFLRGLGAGSAALGALLAGCTVAAPRAPSTTAAPRSGTASATAAPAATAGTAASPKVIRLSSVVIPQDSGLYAALLPDFEQRTGLKVEIATAQDVYGPARAGKADIVLSHYQHSGVLPFVQEGFAEFPRTVFSSPIAVLGPASDPAGARSAADLVDAFAKIEAAGAKFVVNDQDGLKFVADVARRAGGLAANERYLDNGTRGPDAMRAAAQAGAYTIWGLVPFLRLKQQQRQMPLEPLFMRDQLLKSLMVTVVVSPEKVAGVNSEGARKLQQYLAEAGTQAKIRTFRMTGVSEPVWWPAAHDNESGLAAAP